MIKKVLIVSLQESFMNGECAECGPLGQECSLLGLKYALDPRTRNLASGHEMKEKMCLTDNKFFIQTSDKPFCRKFPNVALRRIVTSWSFSVHHYQIVVETLSDMQPMTGELLINSFNESISMKKNFEPGKRFSKLITTQKLIRDSIIRIEWRIEQSFLGSFFSLRTLNQFKIKRVHLNYMSNIDPKKREQLSSTFCAQKYYQSMTHGTQILLEKCS